MFAAYMLSFCLNGCLIIHYVSLLFHVLIVILNFVPLKYTVYQLHELKCEALEMYGT